MKLLFTLAAYLLLVAQTWSAPAKKPVPRNGALEWSFYEDGDDMFLSLSIGTPGMFRG